MTADIYYDAALIDEVASRFDLRLPNAEALAAVVKAIEEGEKPEVIADLATGVGKTYLAAALIEYLAIQGVRDFVIVVNLDTILKKTIDNFTAGSRKFISGSEFSPVVITADRAQNGSVAAALRDPNAVKLFILTVQGMLPPTRQANGESASRQVRDQNEWLDLPFFDYLQQQPDLIVFGDEFHAYSGGAEKFEATIRELGARCLIGLTATPEDPNDKRIIYRYSLAQAIADELVKKPVIVYRQDGHKSAEEQLADAVHLRNVKEPAWHRHAAERGITPVTPVLFVVAKDKAAATELAEILTRPQLLPGDGQVLLIISGSSNEALEALKSVEDPTSPVRAIVAVNKLKEGWDVKNIGVIVAFRALASETLTEQILGRGLRLPYGRRTNIEAIDTVDIVAHDAWSELLARKDSLLQKLVTPTPTSATPSPGIPGGTTPPRGHAHIPGSDEDPAQISLILEREEDENGEPGSDVVLTVRDFELVQEETTEAASAPTKVLKKAKQSAPDIQFPRREREVVPRRFSLTDVDLGQARELGRRYLSDPQIYLVRKVIDVRRNLQDNVEISIETLKQVLATNITQPVAQVEAEMVGRVLGLSIVPQEVDEVIAAEAVIGAFLDGAGAPTGEGADTDWSVERSKLATRALEALIRSTYEDLASQPTYRYRVVSIPRLPPSLILPHPLKTPYEQVFQKHEWYGPWSRSIENAAAFDAERTEFRLARLFDESDGIEWWNRIYTSGEHAGEIWIEWAGGRYYPDFITIDSDGVHWLIEGKSDLAARESDAQEKKAAAEAWVREVNDTGSFGAWRYMLATEKNIYDAYGRWDSLKRLTGSEREPTS